MHLASLWYRTSEPGTQRQISKKGVRQFIVNTPCRGGQSGRRLIKLIIHALRCRRKASRSHRICSAASPDLCRFSRHRRRCPRKRNVSRMNWNVSGPGRHHNPSPEKSSSMALSVPWEIFKIICVGVFFALKYIFIAAAFIITISCFLCAGRQTREVKYRW